MMKMSTTTKIIRMKMIIILIGLFLRLTYTLVWFVILSKIPSGNELKGLSKMVLKIKYLLITQETI